MQDVLVFEAALESDPGISRRISLTADDTLEMLRELVGQAFGWRDRDGAFAGLPDPAVRLDELSLQPGATLSFAHDDHQVVLRLLEKGPGRDGVPVVHGRRGADPDQDPDEVELGVGD